MVQFYSKKIEIRREGMAKEGGRLTRGSAKQTIFPPCAFIKGDKNEITKKHKKIELTWQRSFWSGRLATLQPVMCLRFSSSVQPHRSWVEI